MPKKRRITTEDLYRFQLVSQGRLSPDGEHIVFCLRWVDSKTQKEYYNLWVVATRGGAPRQFTYGDQVDRNPAWSPDSQAIAFTSNRGDDKQAQIYIIPLNGGEARPVTSLKGHIGSFNWSPDGKQFVCAFRKTDQVVQEREADALKKELGVVERHITRLFYKADGVGFLSQEHSHIWAINVRTGRAKQLTFGDMYNEHSPHWSPNGKTIVFISNRSHDPDQMWDQDHLYLISADGGEFHQLDTPPSEKEMPRFSPDGGWVAYIQHGGREAIWQNTNLWVTPADGDGRAKNLTGPFDLHVGQDTINDLDKFQAMPPTWSPDSQRLYFQVTYHGDTLLKSVAVDGTDLQDIVADPGVVGDFTVAESGSKLAYLHGSGHTLGQVWLRDEAKGQTRQLTRFNQNLWRAIDWGEIEEVWFKGLAGNNLQGWILKPPGFAESKTYPSILQIHGGPMAQYGNFLMHEFYYLAAQGYVVYFCNPRGGQGYGETHTKAIYNDWGNRDYADLMAWTDLVEQKPYIDSQRMGVTGGSYGGYMTAWLIGHTNRFKAAVAQRSVSNMISMAGSTDLGAFWESLFGAKPEFWGDVDNYWRQSPLKYIGNAKTPTLVIHSEQDLRCDIEQSEQIFVALKKLGVDTEMVRFPGESHNLSREGRTDRRIARLNHIVRWFDKYLNTKFGNKLYTGSGSGTCGRVSSLGGGVVGSWGGIATGFVSCWTWLSLSGILCSAGEAGGA